MKEGVSLPGNLSNSISIVARTRDILLDWPDICIRFRGSTSVFWPSDLLFRSTTLILQKSDSAAVGCLKVELSTSKGVQQMESRHQTAGERLNIICNSTHRYVGTLLHGKSKALCRGTLLFYSVHSARTKRLFQ